MPTPDERVTLLLGGQAHSDWTQYEIDSDLLTPADAWQLSLVNPNRLLPAEVRPGARIRVLVGPHTVLTGRVDEVDEAVSKNEHSIMLCGRDDAAILLDCSSPLFVARQVTLAEVVSKVVKPLGISRIRIAAAASHTHEKINVEPGESAWDTLVHAAEASGLWPWMEPDGTLVIGGPDYSTPPVGSLIQRRDGRGNNVLNLRLVRNMSGRHSELTVLGQAHGTERANGQHNLRGVARDSGIDYYRPRIVVDHEADSPAVATARARKLMADSRLAGFTLTADVRGHHNGQGQPWQPGQRVNVSSEPLGLDGVYFLMGRRFTRSREGGTRTTLMLKEDGVWTLDAHPHQRKHRRGKNSVPGQIIDVAKPAWSQTP